MNPPRVPADNGARAGGDPPRLQATTCALTLRKRGSIITVSIDVHWRRGKDANAVRRGKMQRHISTCAPRVYVEMSGAGGRPWKGFRFPFHVRPRALAGRTWKAQGTRGNGIVGLAGGVPAGRRSLRRREGRDEEGEETI